MVNVFKKQLNKFSRTNMGFEKYTLYYFNAIIIMTLEVYICEIESEGAHCWQSLVLSMNNSAVSNMRKKIV